MITSHNLPTRWKAVWKHDSWIKPFLGQYKKALATSIALGVLTMVFAAGLMFMSGFLISDAAEHPELGLYSLLLPLGLVQVFGVGKPFLGYLERLTSHDWVLRITSDMRLKLYDTIEGNGIFWTATHRAGDALGLLANDIGHVQNLYLRTVFPLVIAWMLWALTVLLLGAFSPLFALVMLLAIGVLVFLMPLASVLVNGARQFRVKDLSGNLYANAYDQIDGLADWTFAQRKDDYLATITAIDQQISAEEAQIANANRFIDLACQAIFGIASTLLLIWAALHFGSMAQAAAATGVAGRPADWIAAFVLGFFPLLEAFQPLPGATAEANSHLDSLERLHEQSQAGSLQGATTEATAKGNPTLAVKQLRFAYPQSPEIIHGIDLCIQPGQKVAILGPSGCGKSTLVSLMRGDRSATQGSITLHFPDGSSIEPKELGDVICNYISLVQQDTYLFNQSLYRNLTLGDSSISKEEAAAALAAVGLGPLLEKLPKGLNTIVEQAGFNFSGGERHRIALARVLLRKAPIVLLDEPMVSLDPLTEQALLDTMFEVLANRTIVMVTHHLAGIDRMDKVVFLEKGRISMEGSPAQLKEESPRYRQLLAFDQGL